MEDFAGGLETGNCGEGPAGSTLTLVLDWPNSTLSSPINVDVWNGRILLIVLVFVQHFNLWGIISLIGEINLSEFLLSEGRELVDSPCV